jgi:hypothetical protein
VLIIWRRWYFVGLLGVGLAVHGTPELALAIHTNGEPVALDLGRLDVATVLERPYVRVGEHVALHSAGVAFRAGVKLRKVRCVYPICAPTPAGPDRPEKPSFRVFALANGKLDPAPRVQAPGFVGIARPLADLGDRERSIVAGIARDAEGVVVIERDRHPRLLVSLVEVLASALLLAWAVSMFLGGRKPPEAAQGRA